MGKTSMEYCDYTFNPWLGCAKVSEGCKNCFAERSVPVRVLRANGTECFGAGAVRHRTSVGYWKKPIQWNAAAGKSRVCLVCGSTGAESGSIDTDNFCSHCELETYPIQRRVLVDLCDWLDDTVPLEWLSDFLCLIQQTPNLTWLLLTKRPENWGPQFDALSRRTCAPGRNLAQRWVMGHAPSNVWVGISVENQKMLNKRVPELMRIPKKIGFLSCEPLLGPLDFNGHAGRIADWVIVGGESGSKARPCNLSWIRSVLVQCLGFTPCFVKQVGSNSHHRPISDDPESGIRWSTIHKKGGDPEEWPESIRVRQFPESK